MNIDEMVISSSYEGRLMLMLNDKMFMAHATSYNYEGDKLGLFYDITDNNSEKTTLCAQVKKMGNQGILMTLYQNNSNARVELMQIILITGITNYESIDQNDTSMNIFKSLGLGDDIKEGEFTKYHQIFQLFEGYVIKSKVRLVEAIFRHKKDYRLVVNPETRISSAYSMLYTFSEVLGLGSRYLPFVRGCQLSQSTTFRECVLVDNVIIVEVALTYHAVPRVPGTNVSLDIPRNKDIYIMKQHIASRLHIEAASVMLYDASDNILRKEVQLDDTNTVFYEIYSVPIRCTSMNNSHDCIELNMADSSTGWDVKRSLEDRYKMDGNRLILCQNKQWLHDDSVIATDHDVQCCLASVLNIGSSMELIGEGGFGQVYKCVLSPSDETIALKKFSSSLDADAQCISFIREFLVLVTVAAHPNIIRYTDVFLHNNSIFLGMEYVSGKSLRSYLENEKSLPESDIRNFSRDILLGLAHLHDNNIIHRDIKGSNILLTDQGPLKLCDFGISKILSDVSDSNLLRGVSNTPMCGTLRWMAPEVVKKSRYGIMADIWSVGATVVEMITGEVPFYQVPDRTVRLKLLTKKTIEFANPVSEMLRQFLDYCLKADPSERLGAKDLLKLRFFNVET